MSQEHSQLPAGKVMDFGEAMNEVASGKKVRRLEWTDKEIHLILSNEQLMIFKPEDKRLHQLIVTLGDICGKDWVVV